MPYFIISTSDDGQVLFAQPLEGEDDFSISFLHSVNKSIVEEFYTIKDASIILSACQFTSFGVGMPSVAEDDQVFLAKDGLIRIENYNRPIDDLRYSVGRVANHTLHWQGQAVPLNTLAEPGTSLSFGVHEYPSLAASLKLLP